jgi:hypothetical protein
VQVLLAQHGPSFLPHGWQVEVEVVVLVLVVHARSKLEQPVLVGKVLDRQHGSPELPHVQRPALHEP